jgi:membrane-bound metal-dependent hydrolase YbcI (DUF457 family)
MNPLTWFYTINSYALTHPLPTALFLALVISGLFIWYETTDPRNRI